MQITFTANTPEELRQEIVEFLQHQIEHRESLVHTTTSLVVKRQIEYSAIVLKNAKEFIETARIEPVAEVQ